MHPFLEQDLHQFESLLAQAQAYASQFLATLDDRAPGMAPPAPPQDPLPDQGIGAQAALTHFQQKYAHGMTGSAGPRYFGFVTGGSTPASVVGDWLVSAFDQNAVGAADSTAPYIEREAIAWLRQLFGLSDAHAGLFVSGATLSNMVGLAQGRQWVAMELGHNPSQEGLYGIPPVKVLSGSAHASSYKAMSILGMGKSHIQKIANLPNREAVDIAALRTALQELNGPCIVIGNAGVVNTADFDDLQAIADLKKEFNFWFHVDGAFGGVVGVSPRLAHLTNGIDAADSICIDAHKWLNVPYDAAMQFTRHPQIQMAVFENSAAYLGAPTANPDFFHLTPENSRRFRALPTWFSLLAYGRAGYADIIERTCQMASRLGQYIEDSPQFELLSPVTLNLVCFTLKDVQNSQQISDFLARVRNDGRAFFTPTVLWGKPAIRAAFSNWRTQAHDVDMAWDALQKAL